MVKLEEIPATFDPLTGKHTPRVLVMSEEETEWRCSECGGVPDFKVNANPGDPNSPCLLHPVRGKRGA